MPARAPPARPRAAESRLWRPLPVEACSRDGISALAGAGGLLPGVAGFAGLRASRLLTAVSRLVHDELAPGLGALFPPCVCIVGGQETEKGGEETDDGIYVPAQWACDTCAYLDPRAGVWRPLPPMPTARSRCAATAAGSVLYVLGGDEDPNAGERPCAAFERFDMEAGVWEQLPPLPAPGFRLVAAYMHGRVYAAGGSDGKRCLRTTACFDLRARRWGVLAPMPTARCGAAAAVLEGRLYVVGGSDNAQRLLGRLECFDPSAGGPQGSWERLPSMPTPREGCAAAAAGGQLVVAGGLIRGEPRRGCCITDAVECYDLATKVWSRLARMPKRREGPAAAAIGGKVFVLGGITWWEDSDLKADVAEDSTAILDLGPRNKASGRGGPAPPACWAPGPRLPGCAVRLAAAVVAAF